MQASLVQFPERSMFQHLYRWRYAHVVFISKNVPLRRLGQMGTLSEWSLDNWPAFGCLLRLSSFMTIGLSRVPCLFDASGLKGLTPGLSWFLWIWVLTPFLISNFGGRCTCGTLGGWSELGNCFFWGTLGRRRVGCDTCSFVGLNLKAAKLLLFWKCTIAGRQKPHMNCSMLEFRMSSGGMKTSCLTGHLVPSLLMKLHPSHFWVTLSSTFGSTFSVVRVFALAFLAVALMTFDMVWCLARKLTIAEVYHFNAPR